MSGGMCKERHDKTSVLIPVIHCWIKYSGFGVYLILSVSKN